MAIFHFTMKNISAGERQSAVAAAAYRRGAQFTRAATGRSHDYTQKKEVTHREIALPPNAPAWAVERYPSSDEGSERLWNDIEARENEHSRRATAVLAKELEFSLPVELAHEEQVALARDFVTTSLAARGYAADWVIHAKDGNPHVHVMYTERALSDEDGRWGNKIRVPNRRRQLLEFRAEWAMAANRHLALAGHEERIDHRSHEDRGLELEPGVHRGSEPGNPDEYAAWQARGPGGRGHILRQRAVAPGTSGGARETGREHS